MYMISIWFGCLINEGNVYVIGVRLNGSDSRGNHVYDRHVVFNSILISPALTRKKKKKIHEGNMHVICMWLESGSGHEAKDEINVPIALSAFRDKWFMRETLTCI